MSNENIIEANDGNYKDLISSGTVLLDYFAHWCGPCKMIAPFLTAIAADNPDVKIIKINVDENPEATKQFGVRGIPALFVLKDGVVKATKVGGASKSDIIKLIDGVL